MNIFQTLFRNAPTQPANPAAPDPMNPQNPNLQQQNAQPIAGAPIPNPADDPKTPPKSPEVDFSKIWDIDPKQPQPANLGEFSFNIDQNKVGDMFKQIDFTKTITPELLGKINGGGADAVSATLAAMNSMVQEAVKTAVLASTKVTENGLKSTGQRLQDNLPGLVRNHTVSSALREDNPLMKDPAFAPIVSAVTEQMTRQFPQATAQEIREHTRKYFENFAGSAAAFAGKTISDAPVAPGGNTRVVQTDWEKEPT